VGLTSLDVDSRIIERRTAEIRAALDRVRGAIAAAARRAGRDPAVIRIVGITKGFGPETPLAAIAAGLTELGENRIQEARAKIPQVAAHAPERATWHLVGHLQTNKAKLAAELFDWIESVDSLRLAQALSQRRSRQPLQVLLQVKASNEPTKTGFAADELLDVAPEIAALPNLEVRGLMAVAPLDPDLEVARRAFRSVRSLAEQLAALGDPACSMEHLSMGMSGDYEVAIEEGATIVRLGTVLFGSRR
jgi:pyridoxal phosphate enzyme (YggS family)